MFGTSGIRGRVGETVTADLALSVGRAVATRGAESVVVGRDVRSSGSMLLDAVAAGLRECGADVIDLGMASTPTIARAVGWRHADAGVAITASHNPPPDNGLKLWAADGRAFDAEARHEVTRLVEAGRFEAATWDAIGGRTRWEGARARHVEALVEALDGSSVDLEVVVDVGNGTGVVTAEALSAAGCDVETLNAQPDGRFPGRPSEPTAETCRTLRTTVANGEADLGIAHDGDADRMMAVDADGRFVPGDELLALFGRDAILRGLGGTIVAPVNTSLAVDDAVAELGGSVSRTPVGDVHVATRALEVGAGFGGEPSGAWIWPGATPCPDGPLAACRLVALVEAHGPLASQLEAIERLPIRREAVPVEGTDEVMAAVEAAVRDAGHDVETIDGLRVALEDGWFLIRPSGTEPVVRLTAEARTDERADELLETARGYLEAAMER